MLDGMEGVSEWNHRSFEKLTKQLATLSNTEVFLSRA